MVSLAVDQAHLELHRLQVRATNARLKWITYHICLKHLCISSASFKVSVTSKFHVVYYLLKITKIKIVL